MLHSFFAVIFYVIRFYPIIKTVLPFHGTITFQWSPDTDNPLFVKYPWTEWIVKESTKMTSYAVVFVLWVTFVLVTSFEWWFPTLLSNNSGCWWSKWPKQSPTYFVSNLRHQHRCNRLIDFIDSSKERTWLWKWTSNKIGRRCYMKDLLGVICNFVVSNLSF